MTPDDIAAIMNMSVKVIKEMIRIEETWNDDLRHGYDEVDSCF